MHSQWTEDIYPHIKDFNFEICLELAPGHGRNTNMLKEYAKEIHLVDVNESCIVACRNRFGDTDGNCHFFYYVNDGHTLKEMQDDSMTCLYSWDAVVHFDKLVVRDYIHEFARVLRSGSYGFVHHSNYGKKEQHNEWMKNPGWRSNMTAELFQKYCNEARLDNIKQELIRDDLDCISVFQKP
jgi:ubiquinone/menaquinone biosynthesis C-methylase UbiE